MKRVLPLFFVAAVVWLAVQVPGVGVHRAAWSNVCDLVADKFYRVDVDLNNWLVQCREKASRVPWWWSRAEVLKQLQYELDELQVSHLSVYDPEEDRRLWRGEAVDTGLRVRSIDERWVVGRIIKGSVAEKADILPGDELLTIDGEAVGSSWQAETREGEYQFQRGEKKIAVNLVPQELVIDRQPQLQTFKPGVGWLEISSFRGEYFKDENWRKITSGLPNYSKIIVDLRDNAGGNIVAMLRALSPFLCQPQEVGALSQPRRKIEKGPSPPDNLDDMAQLTFLEKYKFVPLMTFPGYGCFKGQATVLINGQSASVSEILAHAMMDRPNSRVWGLPSAGDVLIATWYNLPMLGPGYSLSIPEAQYLTTKGDSLEGGGVWPQKHLDYQLLEALHGDDSWLLRASE